MYFTLLAFIFFFFFFFWFLPSIVLLFGQPNGSHKSYTDRTLALHFDCSTESVCLVSPALFIDVFRWKKAQEENAGKDGKGREASTCRLSKIVLQMKQQQQQQQQQQCVLYTHRA
jgi:hypothetical protein